MCSRSTSPRCYPTGSARPSAPAIRCASSATSLQHLLAHPVSAARPGGRDRRTSRRHVDAAEGGRRSAGGQGRHRRLRGTDGLTRVHADVTPAAVAAARAHSGPPRRCIRRWFGWPFGSPTVEIPDMAGFVRMVRTMFTQRRKTLSNALKPFGLERSVAPADVLASAGLDGQRRPETLDMAEMARSSGLPRPQIRRRLTQPS